MKRRVLVVQPVVTHYRVPFFELVRDGGDVGVEIAAADQFMGFRSDPGFSRIAAPVKTLPGGGAFWQSIDLSRLEPGDGVIFSGNVRFLNLLPDMLVARWRGLRIGWWGHWRSSGGQKRAADFRRWLSSRADMVLTYSAAEREQAIAFGLPGAKVFAAPNTIDDRRIRSLLSGSPRQRDMESPFLGGRPYFLSVGRLIPSKKVDLSIRAVAGLRSPSAPGLLIVGDGPELPALRHLVDILGVGDRVCFAGSITDDADLLPLFRGAVASVSAGPIGLAAPHSLAFHVPVIFADTHNGPEECFLVDRGNAMQCSQTDEALRGAMAALLDQPELLARLRRGAMESALRDVPIQNMVEGFLAACRFLVDVDASGQPGDTRLRTP